MKIYGRGRGAEGDRRRKQRWMEDRKRLKRRIGNEKETEGGKKKKKDQTRRM